MSVSRRLAAVVVADVVGYSRLTERDESGTIERLRAARAELIDPKIAEHGGRIVKTTGDGLLLEFPSSTSALRCAIEVQRGMGTCNADRAAGDRLDFRVGINLGDIIIDGEDILGDGVNVAARLESLAPPGGILIAASVREQVREDLGVGYVDAGKQQVKNIARPVHVYRIALGEGLDRGRRGWLGLWQYGGLKSAWVRRAGVVAAVVVVAAVAALVSRGTLRLGADSASDQPPLYSLLILPFEVAVGDPALASAAPRLTAEVTKAIGDGAHWARVVRPDAAVALAAKSTDPQVLGRAANVRFVIGATLRTTDKGIESTLRIHDARDGKQVNTVRRTYSGTADGDLRPLIRQLASPVREMFGGAAFAEDAASGGENPNGRQLLARAESVDFAADFDAALREQGRLLDAAIKADPDLARAWARRAKYRIDVFRERFDDLADRGQVFAAAEEDSLRAVSLDGRDPYVWNQRALVLGEAGKIEAANAAFQRAEDIDWTRLSGLSGSIWLAMLEGEPEESLRRLESLEKAWGGKTASHFPRACDARVGMGAYAAAIKDCERARAGNDDLPLYLNLAAAYALTGDLAKAAEAKAKILKDLPKFTIGWYEAQQFRPTPKGKAMDKAHLIAGLRKAGLPE